MDRDEALRLLGGGWEGVREWNRRRAAGEEIPDFAGADLRGTYLCGVDLREADLSKANLCGVNLREADLSAADLRGADLGGAYLRGTCLKAMIIDDQTKLEPKWRLVWEVVTQAVPGRYLRGADLRGADLREAD